MPPRDARAQGPRFVVDAMLGSLARKLRIFGFDTLYQREGTDEEIMRLAHEEGRVLLTSDVELWRRSNAAGGLAVLVKGKDDRSRMASLLETTPGFSRRLELGESRCAVCNGELEKVGRAAAEASLPEGRARHRTYYRCMSCQKLYWHGGHWGRLRRLHSTLRKQRV
jgi:uncharacterized protein